jgi:predicted Zn-dependent peptidase
VRDEIRSFFDEHYRTGNLVVAAAGDVDHSKLVADEIDRRFDSTARRIRAVALRPRASRFTCCVASLRPTEQAHLVVAARTCGRHDDRRWAVALLNHVLGGGISSRLFQEIREKRGLAYAVWSDRVHYEEVGALTVSVGTSPEHAPRCSISSLPSSTGSGEKGITDRELAVARGSLAPRRFCRSRIPVRACRASVLVCLLHGKVMPVDEVIARIEAVTSTRSVTA